MHIAWKSAIDEGGLFWATVKPNYINCMIFMFTAVYLVGFEISSDLFTT